VFFDLAPNLRYKKKYVFPGGAIPEPNAPKNPDSYMLPSLRHLAGLQKEGLVIWDGRRKETYISRPFLLLDTADGPGIVYHSGLIGHHGRYGCRLYCDVVGRHKQGCGHYYPALLKPVDYNVPDCDHDDIPVESVCGGSSQEYLANLKYLLQSKDDTQYKERRCETGISKPSIFSGLPAAHITGVPDIFGLDLMHLPTLNHGDLFTSLWSGTLKCEKTDDISTWDFAVFRDPVAWKKHGQQVADALPYIPGSYDRPSRNIAEKISSGYKAKEWQGYLFGLAPALLYGVLPYWCWKNYVKYVRAFRILQQYKIPTVQLLYAHRLLCTFHREFEEIYYQRRADRLHFVRPSIHTTLHVAPEVQHIGPLAYSSQWTLERTIGNLGEEIKQPSNPFKNLSERALRRGQVNALKVIVPQLDRDQYKLPRGSYDVGNGYVLLRARDKRMVGIYGEENQVIRAHLQELVENAGIPLRAGWKLKLARWARLRLPNGQIARSAWRESMKPAWKLRRARCVRVSGLSIL
jgi:hypothetical protein